MKLQLKDWKVKNLSLKANENSKKRKESFNLSMGNFYPEDNNKAFGVGLFIELKDNEFSLKVEMVFLFELDSIIDDEFKNSDFPKINAPAIAFPYVRSFISNITLQSGFAPVILPSINFVEFVKRDRSNNYN